MSEPQLPPILSDRYEVERLIGRGGMASVFLARDLRQDRQVALKVLDPDLAQSLGRDRFLREIAVASKLAHPNIVPLHDSGASGDLLFYVMPFVEGESLRARLDRERQLPLDEALRLTCEVAGALEYAHRHGFVHRDIKPENILLSDGHALVADFGIARALDSAAHEKLTSSGVSIGTPAYMSPEQVTGDTAIDARSDVYSLGCVLYEVLAGEPPFTGATTQSIIAKRMGTPPPRIRVVRPGIPESVEQALLRAMDRTPADRFPSARHFADALAACGQERRTGGARTSRATRGVAAAAALTLVALGAAWVLRGDAGARGASVGREATRIAVLPLVNRSGDPEHAYLADGLADAVIAELARDPRVRVVPRTSAMRFGSGMSEGAMDAGSVDMPGGMSFMGGEGSDTTKAAADSGGGMPGRTSLSETARILRAELLFEGSITRAGDSVRVTASLIRAPSLERVWERTWARHVRDLIGLQHELVAAIVSAVDIGDAPAIAQPRVAQAYDAEAHQAYLLGNHYQTRWKLREAVAAFERAVRLDPTHAGAQAGLARAYYFLAFFGQAPPSVALAGMRRAATAALEQDSLLAEAHAQLALVKMLQEWDWAGAEREFRRALQLSPGDAQIRHDYAHFLLGQGRRRESAEEARQAFELDPVNPMLISCLGWHALFDGRYADAHRHALEANALMPDQWAFVVLGWALLGQGKQDAALDAFREARRLEPSSFTLAALGHALAVSGREAEARATLRELLSRSDREYVSPYDVATVYAGLGDRDETFRWLRRAGEERSMFIVHVGWDARFDRVRDDARFADLTKSQLRLPAPQFAALTAEERRGY